MIVPRLVVAPTDLPVTLAMAKFQTRVEHADDDALLTEYIKIATAKVEKHLGYVLMPQTWEMALDAFPAGEIQLPVIPVVSVSSVVYVDADGLPQTIDVSDYAVDSYGGWVIPVDEWPSPMEVANAVTIRWVAGRGCPDNVRGAILLLIGLLYDNRDAASEKALHEMPLGVDYLLQQDRQMFV